MTLRVPDRKTYWFGNAWENWYMHHDWMRDPDEYIECCGCQNERRILIEAIETWLFMMEPVYD